MQERRHVKTTPGEPHAAPEYAPHPVRKEEGGNVQTDDINIPIVAILVAFFAVLLSVTIVSLQAAFYHYAAYEKAHKTVAQDAPGTFLGDILAQQHDHLSGKADPLPETAPVRTGPATGNASAPATKPRQRMPIDVALQQIEKEYAPR